MPAQPLTQAQLDDAARLKTRFADWQQRRKDAGLPSSQEAASDLLGFNQSSMSQYLNGKIPLNPSAAAKFSSVLECSIGDFSPTLAEHVATLAAALPTEQPSSLPPKSAVRIHVGEQPNAIPIRRMNISARAGVVNFEREYDTSFGADLHIPVDVIEDLRLNPDSLIAIKVEGESMEPLMFDGDLIVVDLSDRRLINREVYLVKFDYQPCVKQMIYRGAQWYLHSLHPDPMHGDCNANSKPFEVVGRVVYQPGRKLTGRV